MAGRVFLSSLRVIDFTLLSSRFTLPPRTFELTRTQGRLSCPTHRQAAGRIGASLHAFNAHLTRTASDAVSRGFISSQLRPELFDVSYSFHKSRLGSAISLPRRDETVNYDYAKFVRHFQGTRVVGYSYGRQHRLRVCHLKGDEYLFQRQH